MLLALSRAFAPLARRTPAAAPGPQGETRWARALRHQADRAHLATLDDRLLRDIGLPSARAEAPPWLDRWR